VDLANLKKTIHQLERERTNLQVHTHTPLKLEVERELELELELEVILEGVAWTALTHNDQLHIVAEMFLFGGITARLCCYDVVTCQPQAEISEQRRENHHVIEDVKTRDVKVRPRDHKSSFLSA
jgi:hypothetical protein